MLTHLVLICAVVQANTPVITSALKGATPLRQTYGMLMLAAPVAPVATPKVTPKAAVFDAGSVAVADAGTPVLAVDAGVASKPFEMTPEVKTLVDRVQSFYEKTSDFSSDFKQEYTYKAFKRTQVSTGTVIFKKPGLMRWEYLTPGLKTFVLGGERVYAYDPEAKLLTRANIGTNKLSASVTFLFGQGKLADEFAITQKDCKTCTGTLLVLNPLKPDARFQRVMLEVDPKTAQVLKSTVVDPDGSENVISFLNLKTNVGIDEKAFKLSPPTGTQIQDFTGGIGMKRLDVTPDAGK